MNDQEAAQTLRTPLYDQHVAAGAQMVPFAGWQMPLLYKGIVQEHQHTRTACSIFDVSHMGRISVSGPAGDDVLERLTTRRLGGMPAGKMRYTYMCNERGGILDDMVIARYEDRWLVVCNASNRAKIFDWIVGHAEGTDATIEDVTLQTAMVAIQGPQAFELVRPMIPFEFAGLKNWSFLAGNYMGVDFSVSRSGYTGEDGMELIVPATVIPFIWQQLTASQEPDTESPIQPAGLGARDTLRLEAGLPLYGHELTDETDPIAAGFGWAVNLDKDFIGAEALRRVAADGPARILKGLHLQGRRIARQDAVVEAGSGRVIGQVTSGTLGPAVDKSIAMAYLDKDYAVAGQQVTVKLRAQAIPATVVDLPFYRARK